jgi:uroporphyrinogen-III synthase
MRVLVTRPEPEAQSFAQALAARGHIALLAPMLRVEARPAPGHLEERLAAAQAVLVSSANGARALAAATKVRGYRLFAVGDATQRAARQAGFGDVTSAGGDSPALIAFVSKRLTPADGPVAHVGGAHRAGDVTGALRAAGFRVDEITLYETRPADVVPEDVSQAIQAGGIDAATFFSPRTAQAFVKVATQAGLAPFFAGVAAVAISPAALDGASGLPWRARIAARAPTQDGVLAALDALAPPNTGSPPMSDDKKPIEPPTTDKAGTSATSESAGTATTPADDRFTTPPTAATPPRRGVGVVGAFVTGVIASIAVLAGALALYGAAPDTVRGWFRAGPADSAKAPVSSEAMAAALKPLEARLAQLEAKARALDAVAAQAAQLKELQDKLAAQETRLVALRELTAKVDDVARSADPDAAARLASQLTQARQELAALRADVASLKSRQETADTTIRALSQRPPTATATPDATGDAARQMAAMLDRLERLEKRDAQAAGALAGAVDSAAVARAVGEAEARLREQMARSGVEIERAREATAKLSERITAIDRDVAARLEGLRKDVTASAAGDRRAGDRASAAIGIATRLRQAIDAGGPFVADAELLKPLAAEDAAIAAIQGELAAFATAGVSTRRQLAGEFPDIARRVIAADLADDSWGERLWGKIKQLVSIRRVGEDTKGASPEAILARAEAAMEGGDLTKAVGEMKGLKSPAGDPARDWLQRAESHLAAQRAVDKLSLHGIALLSRTAPQ